MNHRIAKQLAEVIIDKLKPHMARIEIAGSIRRELLACGCIDVVVIKGENYSGTKLIMLFDDIKAEIKDAEAGRIRISLSQGIDFEITFTTEEAWGYAITHKTGSMHFNYAIMKKLVKNGYYLKHGMIYRNADNKPWPVYEEKDFFKLCSQKWIEPHLRNFEQINLWK